MKKHLFKELGIDFLKAYCYEFMAQAIIYVIKTEVNDKSVKNISLLKYVLSSQVQESCLRNALTSLNYFSKNDDIKVQVTTTLVKCVLGNSLETNGQFLEMFSPEIKYSKILLYLTNCILNNKDFISKSGIINQIFKDCIGYLIELGFVANENHEASLIDIDKLFNHLESIRQ